MPYYLERIDRNLSIVDNITERVMNWSPLVQDELRLLLHDHFSQPRHYLSIIGEVAKSVDSPKEMAQNLGLEPATVSHYLHTLVKWGLIQREVPATEREPGHSRLSRYTVADPYLRFYYRFLEPHLANIVRGANKAVWRTIEWNWRAFVGTHTFEELCREWVYAAAALGQQIAQTCGRNGQLISPRWPQAKIGAFQTKTDVRQPASLFLIQLSTTALKQWAEAHPQAQIHLNFPGTGYGGLLREKVLPIVSQLPDNVTIWEYPDEPATPPTPPVELAWFPDEEAAAAMADASERFFSLPELALTNIEQQHHIFAAAFYRGVRYHHDRLAAAAQPLTVRFDRGQKGLWVQGEAVFLEGITDGAAAIQTYREQMNQGEIPVVTGVYTDAVRLLVCQKRQHNGASHEQSTATP